MNGIFRHKFTIFGDWIALISGIAMAALFTFLMAVDDALTAGDRIASLVICCLGVLTAILSIIGLRQTRRIYLRIEEDRIRGYTPWRREFDCPIRDVDRVAWGGTGLTITLKNGTSYNFVNLVNNAELGAYLDQRTFVPIQTELSREDLAEAILRAKQTARRRGLAAAFTCFLLLPEILIPALLTGGRELDAFGNADWMIFGGMAAALLVTLVLFWVLMRRWVRAQKNYEDLLRAKPAD